MQNKHIALSVVIPTYNEEARLEKTLRSISSFFKRKPENYEIVVSDDGSHDGTVPLVKALMREIPQLRLVQHITNHGKGWAVRTGMLSARGRYRLFMDADGSTAIDHWIGMRDSLEQGADVVVSSRHARGALIQEKQVFYRVVLGHAFRSLVSAMFKLPIVDTQNGFKAFTAEAAERVFRRQRTRAWAFDVEILSISHMLGLLIAEIPVVWVDDARSRVRALAMPKMLLDLFRIKRSLKRQFAPAIEPQWDRIALGKQI